MGKGNIHEVGRGDFVSVGDDLERPPEAARRGRKREGRVSGDGEERASAITSFFSRRPPRPRFVASASPSPP
jgi:hypothetical protein